MEIKINKNIKIWKEFNPIELSLDNDLLAPANPKRELARIGFNQERVWIKNRWFDVIPLSDLFRKRNKHDGYYRVVYIQINMDNGEYYIGKANRPKWSELLRYQGSGLKFLSKYKKNEEHFARYYIALCETAEETEQIESSIVDKDLLSDEKCLNLVAGGGGTTRHPSIAETSEKKRQHMLNNPEQYAPMIEASKDAFQSGDTPELRARNQRIKEVMSTDKYREMSRERILSWKDENPKDYAKSRKNNAEAMKAPEVQEKRKASLDKWKKENPEEYNAWQEKRLKSCTSKKAKEKRKASLNEWKEKNPEKAQENEKKRTKAAAEKLSKEVCMLDLQTGEILKTFPSQHAVARWLVEKGIAKNTNCVSSISSVCLRRPCSTGYGYRKKAYGYDWRFKSDLE